LSLVCVLILRQMSHLRDEITIRAPVESLALSKRPAGASLVRLRFDQQAQKKWSGIRMRALNLRPSRLLLVLCSLASLPSLAGSSCGPDGKTFGVAEDGRVALLEIVLGGAVRALHAGNEDVSVKLMGTAVRVDPSQTFAALALAAGQHLDPAGGAGITGCARELAAALQGLAGQLRQASAETRAQGDAAGAGLSTIEQVCARHFISHRLRLAVRWMEMQSGAAEAALRREGGTPHALAAAPAEFQAAVPSMLQGDKEAAAAAAVRLLQRLVGVLRAQRAAGDAPGELETLLSMARATMLFHQYGSATLLLERARHAAPADAQAHCLLENAREAALDWRGRAGRLPALSGVLEALEARAAAGRAGPGASQCVAPFAALAAPLSPRIALLVAASAARRELAAWERGGVPPFAHAPGAPGAARGLRVGYLSSEFGDNSVGREVAAIAAAHARGRRVRALCFALGARAAPGVEALRWQEAASALCEGGLRQLAALDDRAAAAEVNRAGLHVLVDLNGWMPGHRAAVLALQPAPLQLGYKNFVGSMGAPFEPFIASDRSRSDPLPTSPPPPPAPDADAASDDGAAQRGVAAGLRGRLFGALAVAPALLLRHRGLRALAPRVSRRGAAPRGAGALLARPAPHCCVPQGVCKVAAAATPAAA